MLNTVDKNILLKLKAHQGCCTVKELHTAVPDLTMDMLCKYLLFMRNKLKRKEGSWIYFDGETPTEKTKIWLDIGVYTKLMV